YADNSAHQITRFVCSQLQQSIEMREATRLTGSLKGGLDAALVSTPRKLKVSNHKSELASGHQRDLFRKGQCDLHRVAHFFVERGRNALRVLFRVAGFPLEPQFDFALLALIELNLLYVIENIGVHIERGDGNQIVELAHKHFLVPSSVCLPDQFVFATAVTSLWSKRGPIVGSISDQRHSQIVE